jgi:hypothetical protein
LLFTVACMSLVSALFQIYVKLFLDIVIDDFVENFKRYLLIIKRALIIGIIEKKSLKY